MGKKFDEEFDFFDEREDENEIIIPILPVKDTVLFPHAVMPLNIGRRRTLNLISEYGDRNSIIGIVAQKDKDEEEPSPEGLYKTGTTAKILRSIKKSEKNYLIVVQGIQKFKVKKYVQVEPFMMAKVALIDEYAVIDTEIEAIMRNIVSLTKEVIGSYPEFPESTKTVIENIKEPDKLVNIIMSYLPIDNEKKMYVLEKKNLKDTMMAALEILQQQIELIKLTQKIRSEVRDKMDQNQKEFLLRQQLRAIQKELGELDEEGEVIEELRKRLKEAKLPPEVEKIAQKELRRLASIQPSTPEYTVSRTYLEWICDLPWSKSTEDNLDIAHAREVLNKDHHDLEKVKERILEYLAVRQLNKDMKGPILCFIGPPGVGKTSLGQSIANALGRKFIRISLGGVRDEAEIRGHRKTYIGAMPGKIIQSLKRAGTNNPVFMMDEIDKLGRDWRGDPTSALLEVLDPEQNHSFMDHYLNVPFDLSKVMFIMTANIQDTIPPALLDRMEVLELPGYTHEEKVQIAEKHLIPKQIKEHGLKIEDVKFTRAAIEKIIEEYTREAGVRNLERNIGTICRKIAVGVVEKKWKSYKVTPASVEKFLGPVKYLPEVKDRVDMPGVATALAKTSAGGEILFIEVTSMSGKGNLKLTGKLGEVMKESAQIAVSYVRSKSYTLEIPKDYFEKHDIHIHVPAGAIPKDGPSAGITIATALVSLLTGVKVRKDLAMTGEITLRGAVLPVGGIKDKVLAALRNDIKNVIIPEKNKKDTKEIPKHLLKKINIIYVKTIDDVLEVALEKNVFKNLQEKYLNNYTNNA